jgi:hypothetical protein
MASEKATLNNRERRLLAKQVGTLYLYTQTTCMPMVDSPHKYETNLSLSF